MNPYYWTSQLVQLNVCSRLRRLAVAYFVLAKGINCNGEIHLKQFDFEVQDKDEKGLLCTLSKLALQVQAQYKHSVRAKTAPKMTAHNFGVVYPVLVLRSRPMGAHPTKTVFTPTEGVHGIGEDTYRIKVGP